MKLYAVGDIHGCYEELRELLELINDDRGDDIAKVVFIGDYIDRGPDSALVVDYLNEQRKKPRDGFEYVFLKGNHEDMFIRGVLDRTSRDQSDMFWYNGGTQTKRSYDEHNMIFKDHAEFYHSLERYHRHGDFFFVHAGLTPTETLEEALRNVSWMDDDPCLWAREWNDHDGEFPENVFIVHGHTPVPDVTFHNNQINIDTGCVYGKPDRVGYGQLTAVRLDGRTKKEINVFQVKRKY